jgi:hypothetical protein
MLGQVMQIISGYIMLGQVMSGQIRIGQVRTGFVCLVSIDQNMSV